MVRRVLANCGYPVLELHRVRYGEVRLDELDLEEGEAAAVEGPMLDWARALLTSLSSSTEREQQRGGDADEVAAVVSGGRKARGGGRSGGSGSRDGAAAVANAERDLDAEMAEAARRECCLLPTSPTSCRWWPSRRASTSTLPSRRCGSTMATSCERCRRSTIPRDRVRGAHTPA